MAIVLQFDSVTIVHRDNPSRHDDLDQCIQNKDIQKLRSCLLAKSLSDVPPKYIIKIIEADWHEGVDLLIEKFPEISRRKMRYFKAAVSECAFKAVQYFSPEQFSLSDEYIADAIEALDGDVKSDAFIQIVEWLIERGHPVSGRLFYSFAFIAYSDADVLLKLAELLIKHGADPNYKSIDEDERDLSDPLLFLLDSYCYRKTSIIPKYHGKQAPVNLGAVKALLAVGADGTAVDRRHNNVLHHFGFIADQDEASMQELYRLLIEHGADPTAKNSSGYPPLLWGVNPDCSLSKIIMIQNGADLTVRGPDKSTFGHMLFINPPKEERVNRIIALLKAYGFNFDLKDNEGVSVAKCVQGWEDMHPHPSKRIKQDGALR